MSVLTPGTAGAGQIVRGVVRLLANLDYRALTEFPLPDGRRADVAALDGKGRIVIVEIKSSVADFQADGKWRCYLDNCDGFFFAVGPQFPQRILPDDTGLIVADGFAGAIIRAAPPMTLSGARRRSLLLRFARTASARLCLLSDPGCGAMEPGW